MTDVTDSDASHDDSSADRDRDWYARRWDRLCDELNTSDPSEVLARVQAMKRQINQSRSPEQSSDEEGLVTVSEVEEVFREMNRRMEKLRERNTALIQGMEDEEEMEESVRDLYEQTERLLDSLDAATMDEARERIRTLNQRLEDLYREREKLAQSGLSDVQAALDEIDRLRDERDVLWRECDRLQEQLNVGDGAAEAAPPSAPETSAVTAAVRDQLGLTTPGQVEAFVQLVTQLHERVRARAAALGTQLDDAPDSAVEMLHSVAAHLDALDFSASAPDENALPAQAGDVLGIRTVEEARELDALIADMTDRLERLSAEQEQLEEAGLTANAALGMIKNMEAQLDALYHGSESPRNGTYNAPPASSLDDSLRHRIAHFTDTDPEAIDDLPRATRVLTDRLEQFFAQHQALVEAGIGAEEAVAMIESMEDQLNDLYRSRQVERDAADRLAALKDVHGISTHEEAEELSQLARQMEEQLTEDKRKLQELGLENIGDAVDMIENMEDQLTDLYEDREALRRVQSVGNSDDQSTLEQLEALYAERDRLQQALGVSSPEEIIEMVESLNTQLDELYKGRDADVDPEERHDVLLWEPEEPDVSSPEDESPSSGTDTSLTMNSMEHQLEALYQEKEALLQHGFSDAQEAVLQLETQQEQIDALQRVNHTYEQRFERLESNVGTANISQLVDLIQALESEADASLSDLLATTPERSESLEYELDLEAATPFVDDETLDRLDEMESDDLDALSVGVVRLDDDGTVEYLNEAALQLPGLSSTEDATSVVGKNFFRDLAPSTNNNLFYGRFQQGQRRGALDARFPYTFTTPGEDPQPFAVHLHRKPDGNATWLLYRPS
jgi:photoactive yellow protein